jgi:4'-phosphopantetheinyl transferase
VRLRVVPGAVHVWRVDLDTAGGQIGLLSPAERERGREIVPETPRRRWIQARGVLRELLGLYLGRDPRTLELRAGPHGKPELQGHEAPGEPELGFNLSHSGGLALYAFAADARVGIDVELPRTNLRAAALAERVFGPEAAARLRRMGPAERDHAFLRAWVRHEATLKLLGASIARSRPGDEGAGAAFLAELDPGAGAVAAFATSLAPARIDCWTWAPAAGERARGS